MQDLLELFRHNTWADVKVFDVALGLDREQLQREAHGTRDSVIGTLGHLVHVEDAYLAMIERRPREALGFNAEYVAHDLDWFAARVPVVGSAYLRVLESSAPNGLDFDLGIPWFSFPISAREGLRQVLTHSSQHRSQVLSWLSAQGVETPDLDYVLMLGEHRKR